MGLLVPSFLWLLSLLAVIIVFYLFRKQFDKTRVPSTFLWNQVIEEWQASKWWKKLQQNLLFYLQLLFIILIVFALARPFVTTDRLSGETGAVVLDTSATMSAGDGETKFDQAKKEVLDLIDTLGDDQSLTMVTSGAVPTMIFAKETDKRKMKKIVEELSVTYEEENIQEAISLALSYIANQQGSVYVFSDDVKKNEVSEVQHQVVVNNIGGEVKNLSLRTFGVKNNQATATVKNEMPEASTVSVSVYSEDEALIEAKNEKVNSGESFTFQFDGLPEGTYFKAQIKNEDDYKVDNTLYTFSEVEATPQVYLAGDVSPFIKRAITLLGYDPVTLSIEGDSFSYPEREDAIYVLNGVAREDWPETGGILLFSPMIQDFNGYEVKEKIELEKTLMSKDQAVLEYVSMEDVYLNAAYPTSIPLEPIVTSGDTPVLLSGKLEGRPMMFASFDIEDSDWPLHPSFPIFIQNAIQYVSEDQHFLGSYSPGQTIDLPYSSTTKGAVLEDSKGSHLGDLSTDEWSQAAPYQPDLYTIVEERTDGFQEKRFIVTLPSNERSPISSESFALGEETTAVTESGKIEWWYVLAGLGLLILLIEWEVYRRGHAF
ncbi:vWA domain-containing protein [Alkalihalobacillus sp. CinArs1]|uniref:vWA domain-containing protein n=1 Tax=Alkalihalobacillus sp. CinArs1 TaxID=2995314 RepID=UPI0022DD1E9B|nr:BatA and WFA domain-containing protein [Alkalihalobacillus sp. CinArs1]